ncbi:MAG: pectate lyase, partial [Duncaniella sp.]|nr:pectate lyase [Duncaniella sp.]
MKKSLRFSFIAVFMAAVCALGASAQGNWAFANISQTDIDNLTADAANWEHESTDSNNRFKNTTAISASALKANGVELEVTKGLVFETTVADGIRVDVKGKRLAMNKAGKIVIPSLKAGMLVTVKCQSSSKTEARGFNVTNLTPVSGVFNQTSLDAQTNVGSVTADGDVVLANTGGMYVTSITVAEEGGEVPAAPTPGGGTALNLAVHQMSLTLKNGDMKYFNTADVASVVIDGNKITVNEKAEGSSPVVLDNVVGTMSFRKGQKADDPVIDNPAGKVAIREAKGWQESAYITWDNFQDADNYKVYVKGGQYADWSEIDAPLVRNYGSYGRADVVGLKAGSYALRVVPVADKVDNTEAANEVSGLSVVNYDRSGYAHMNFNGGVGAYNNDGTLKAGAKVFYITTDNFATVTMDVVNNNKGGTVACTGIGEIFAAMQKGFNTTPVAVRFIGTIDGSKIPSSQLLTDQGGLLLKANDKTTDLQVTIEGIGDDATITNFGIGLVNGAGVEVRNIGVLLVPAAKDCMEIKGTNHVWIHNCDLFYAHKGSGDQVKGDGTMDCKDGCSYATFSYNHFLDAGKSFLCGMKKETVDNLICYHHNWLDHSDSRHPRIRTSTVHIWNNYYDGCAKYGVGATMGCSVFVEGNYFRGTKRPMMSSKQGTDATGDGTFSGEDGGIIKSFGNVMAERSKNFSYITWQENNTSFDAYEAATRDEIVPSSVKTLAGGTTYNNFDTDPARMYEYTPLEAHEVPAAVLGYYGAGRLNHGDISYKFNNAVDDDDYARSAE